jgi:hypothetical protein|tara:strand:+ start:56 stop:229 length:174 start_codon:yes stop_codon:yes gene_type:complete
MPKGKGTYGSKRGRPKKSKDSTSWGKLSDKEKEKILLKERANRYLKSPIFTKKMFRR